MSNTGRCYLSGSDLSAGAVEGSSRASVTISRVLLLSFSKTSRLGITLQTVLWRYGQIPGTGYSPVTPTATRIGTRLDCPATSARSGSRNAPIRDRVDLSGFDWVALPIQEEDFRRAGCIQPSACDFHDVPSRDLPTRQAHHSEGEPCRPVRAIRQTSWKEMKWTIFPNLSET